MKEYIDPKGKVIYYNEEDMFAIETRKLRANKYKVLIFRAKDIEMALSQYYALDVLKDTNKYFTRMNVGEDKEEVIYMIKGNIEVETATRYNPLKIPTNFDKKRVVKIYNFPLSLCTKWDNYDYSILAMSGRGWSKNALIYMLLSDYFSKSFDEQLKFVVSALPKLNDEKRASGAKEDSVCLNSITMLKAKDDTSIEDLL